MKMTAWKYDIQSYHNTKKMKELIQKLNRDTTWYDDNMTRIKNKWPNVNKTVWE